MARKSSLPADLSPTQVIALQDALLANADRLLIAALTMLDSGDVSLARSLAILGMEESGKAIALHERRVTMEYSLEGEGFVNKGLTGLWADHALKLATVHRFVVQEQYWFGTESADPGENEQILGTIDAWKHNHNVLKQRGFYVDVTPDGDPVTPDKVADAGAVRAVIGHVHQIGWQLRLGEHIEGKSQLERMQDVLPSTEEETEGMRKLLSSVDPVMVEEILESMRQGKPGEKLNNAGYSFQLPSTPFQNVGRPGYEAQDRELSALWDDAAGVSEGDRNSND